MNKLMTTYYTLLHISTAKRWATVKFYSKEALEQHVNLYIAPFPARIYIGEAVFSFTGGDGHEVTMSEFEVLELEE